jgi:hypothetical protein
MSYKQYWCPVEQGVIAGDANGVWWQFHEECDLSLDHPGIEFPHMIDMEIWPFDDEEHVYYRAKCVCGYFSSKQIREKSAVRLWWDHYQRAKAQVKQGVDTPAD